MRNVRSCTMLLKPNIVRINTMMSGYKEIGYYGAKGMRSVRSCTMLLNPNIVRINNMMSGYKEIGYYGAQGIFIDRNGCVVLFFPKKWWLIMPQLYEMHQTVLRNGCIGFCKTTLGFSKPQILQFCLLTYPPE